jgi:LPXTG-motif cell wall-anchored protein
MKTAAIIILIVGLLMTLYTGFGYMTKEKVLDMGDIEMTMNKQHTAAWSPFVGLGVMLVGGALLVVSKKK